MGQRVDPDLTLKPEVANVYYFGCVDQPGHYMHKPNLRTDWEFTYSNPWGLRIDGGLIPYGGGSSLNHKNGWTALSFADYTVDPRPGSNSAFLADGTLTFDEMAELAKQHFPKIMARIGKIPPLAEAR